MKRLSAGDIDRIKVQELGLNPDRYSLQSVEALACSLRRAAGYLSPCNMATLIRAVVNALEGISSDTEALREKVESVLEALIAHGDLLEQKDITTGEGGPLVYTAPPSFVLRKSGAALLLGVVPDLRTPLPSEVEERIEYLGHVRRLPSASGGSVKHELQQFGILELTDDYWLRSPVVVPADRHVATANDALSKLPVFSSDIPGLTILDAEQPVRYYPGRWTALKSHTGRYVGRRKQLYGADLWCYVETLDGRARRFCDLPLQNSRHRGCDSAWHLQMALDAMRDRAQEFVVSAEIATEHIFKFFSPIPQWAQRRLSAVGKPVDIKGCLLAYMIGADEAEEERTYLSESLWLKEAK